MLPSHTAAVMSGNPPATAAPESSKAKKPRKSRSKGLRATTGCKTCRSRHMKCDEAKPRCGPCKRSARECEYGDPTQVRQVHMLKCLYQTVAIHARLQ